VLLLAAGHFRSAPENPTKQNCSHMPTSVGRLQRARSARAQGKFQRSEAHPFFCQVPQSSVRSKLAVMLQGVLFSERVARFPLNDMLSVFVGLAFLRTFACVLLCSQFGGPRWRTKTSAICHGWDWS